MTESVSSEPLAFSRDADIAFVTIDRPGRRNALSMDMLHQLDEFVTGVADSGCKALVVQSSTPSIFWMPSPCGLLIRNVCPSSTRRIRSASSALSAV